MQHLKQFKHTWLPLAAIALLLSWGCQQAPTAGEGAEGDSATEEQDGGSASAGSEAPEAQLRSATLDAGMPLRVRTTNTLSTKAAASGEAFVASLEEPIVDGTWVIAPKGATVRGIVVDSDPGGRVKGVASLSIRLTQLETADGQTIDITTGTYGAEAQSTKKKDATKVGIASGVGAAIGAIAGGGKGAAIGAGVGAGAGSGAVLATRGDPAVIPSESVITLTLREPVTITAKN